MKFRSDTADSSGSLLQKLSEMSSKFRVRLSRRRLTAARREAGTDSAELASLSEERIAAPASTSSNKYSSTDSDSAHRQLASHSSPPPPPASSSHKTTGVTWEKLHRIEQQFVSDASPFVEWAHLDKDEIVSSALHTGRVTSALAYLHFREQSSHEDKRILDSESDLQTAESVDQHVDPPINESFLFPVVLILIY